MHFVSKGDKYVNNQKPWEMDDEKEQRKVVLGLLALLWELAVFLEPFLPESALKIQSAYKKSNKSLQVEKLSGPLFPRL